MTLTLSLLNFVTILRCAIKALLSSHTFRVLVLTGLETSKASTFVTAGEIPSGTHTLPLYLCVFHPHCLKPRQLRDASLA